MQHATDTPLEISLPSAMELCQLGLATLVDVRQPFEIEMRGGIPGSVPIPLFDMKAMLGETLSAEEQEALDASPPGAFETRQFFSTVNQLHHAQHHLLLCICNSGRRSQGAASALRSLGYARSLSVAGGFQAWKKLQLQPPD